MCDIFAFASVFLFFFNDTATTEIYTLSLHDALPISRGYTNAQLISATLFPIVPVQKEGGIIPVFDKEAFKIYATERALRANSNEMSPEGITTVSLKTEEHDIAYPIDYRETKEAAWDLQKYGTRTVKDIVDLGREKEAADLAQNLATYPTGDRKSTRLNSSHTDISRMPSSA